MLTAVSLQEEFLSGTRRMLAALSGFHLWAVWFAVHIRGIDPPLGVSNAECFAQYYVRRGRVPD